MSSGGNRCSKGKPCFTACINRDYLCRFNLAERLKEPLRKIGDEISERGAGVADHIGKNVAAWKTGKVLGNLVSSYLEGRYGIPREASVKLAESVIQGLAATGLDIKHIKNADEFSKKLFAELAAAFIGKTSHTGAELMLSAKEVSTIVEAALPVLAGKISGIGTSILANRLPTPKELLAIVQERSRNDIGRVQAFLRPYANFAEPELEDIAEILGDMALVVLVGVKGKMDAAQQQKKSRAIKAS